jgi:hypothetical protein
MNQALIAIHSTEYSAVTLMIMLMMMMMIIIIIIRFLTCRLNSTSVYYKTNTNILIIIMAVAVPGDRSVIKKEAENILKYKDLITEIQRMWNVKAKVIPPLTGTTETISKSVGQ